ncbi:calcium-binding protein [Shimia sp. SDUM112013]|uniref:calcium-binding protein n=1 Tax=Shimia sp. SDUM112013 TaxID=3136160 RepID=UPI0032EFE9B3
MATYFDTSVSPFQANTYATGIQIGSDIATLANGGYVVVWGSQNQDGSSTGIFGQIYEDDGQARGGEFQINQTTLGTQSGPSVAAHPGGGFHVLYSSQAADSSGPGILGRGFDASGTPITDEYLANAGDEDGNQYFPDAYIYETTGLQGTVSRMQAVWISHPTGQEAVPGVSAGQILLGSSRVRLEEIDAGSRPIQGFDEEDPVRSNAELVQLDDGRALAVWQVSDHSEPNTVQPAILARISSASGFFAGRQDIVVARGTEDAPPMRPSVASLDNGGFVVAYDREVFGRQNVFWRMFDEDGSGYREGSVRHEGGVTNDEGITTFPIGTTFAPERFSQVVGIEGGGFLLFWWSPNHEGTPQGIRAQEFDEEGNAVAAMAEIANDIPVNGDMEVVRLPDGDFMLTWSSNALGEDGIDIMVTRLSRFGDLRGDEGANAITGGSLGDRIDGGAGDDTLTGGNGGDTIIGRDGNDVIIGGGDTRDLRDVVYAGAGNDSVSGGWGNDELRGDAGNDTIEGGFGSDTVIGGLGDDSITGSAFSDMMLGSSGNDFINGGFGHDSLNGGEGADRFFHIGVEDHGSDWIQDFDGEEGDVLVFGNVNATADDFQINYAQRDFSGLDTVEEAFIIYRPTGQIIWALVDGGAQDSIVLQISGQRADLVEPDPTDGPGDFPTDLPTDFPSDLPA